MSHPKTKSYEEKEEEKNQLHINKMSFPEF